MQMVKLYPNEFRETFECYRGSRVIVWFDFWNHMNFNFEFEIKVSLLNCKFSNLFGMFKIM